MPRQANPRGGGEDIPDDFRELTYNQRTKKLQNVDPKKVAGPPADKANPRTRKPTKVESVGIAMMGGKPADFEINKAKGEK